MIGSHIFAVISASGRKSTGGGGGGTTDPNFANVSLLLHMDGANASTTFTDSSSGARTMTAHGGAAISTAQSEFGGASGTFPSNGSYVSTPNNAAFQFGTGDFTIEGWVRPTAFTNAEGIVIGLVQVGTNNLWFLCTNTAGKLKYQNNPINVVTTVAAMTLNTWNHVAVTRSGTTTRIFLNGNLEASVSDSFNYGNSPSFSLTVGGDNVGATSAQFFGFLDDMRVTKGVARYTASFTPPVAAFPDS